MNGRLAFTYSPSLPYSCSLDALTDSDYCLLLWSRNAATTPWGRLEWESALYRSVQEKRAFLVTARLEETALPALLAARLRVDLFPELQPGVGFESVYNIATVQISQSADFPYVHVMIDGGSVSKANTKPQECCCPKGTAKEKVSCFS